MCSYACIITTPSPHLKATSLQVLVPAGSEPNDRQRHHVERKLRPGIRHRHRDSHECIAKGVDLVDKLQEAVSRAANGTRPQQLQQRGRPDGVGQDRSSGPTVHAAWESEGERETQEPEGHAGCAPGVIAAETHQRVGEAGPVSEEESHTCRGSFGAHERGSGLQVGAGHGVVA